MSKNSHLLSYGSYKMIAVEHLSSINRLFVNYILSIKNIFITISFSHLLDDLVLSRM